MYWWYINTLTMHCICALSCCLSLLLLHSQESSDYSHMDLENTSRGCLSAEACHLSPTGPHLPGRSPLKPPNVTFSPSIFLSQPGGGVSSTVSYTAHIRPALVPTQREELDQGSSSTPIRAGDHRGGITSPSYLTSIHSPISASKRGAESSEVSNITVQDTSS